RKLVDITPFIQEATKLLRSALPSTITLDVTISSNSDSYIMADPAEIHQVVMNLCTNASQSIDGSHGTIAITLEDYLAEDHLQSTHSGMDQGHYLMLRISDSGKGISRSVIPRIFEPFFTTKKVGEGTGLGLSVVHGIVTDMGGSIFVDSVNGKGTTFTIYFPVADKLFMSKSRETQKAVPKGSGEKVHLVDDDVVLLNMMGRMLEELNYRCTKCSSGVEALSLFKKDPQHYDLLLTGQTMPGITGDSLCLAVRSVRTDIPIVLCTGFSEQLTPARISELGIDAFLSKPILLDRLGQTLDDLLNR
ncbi:MAG: response regulator, partial [Desulfobacterales bacterium]|nr:response regulator [Desulfobacterales bacterium]